ncbi:histone H2A type 2-B-like [Discoglossus pictus]
MRLNVKMSGRNQQGAKVRAKSRSRTSRAGLLFPVGRILRFLHKGNYAERVGAGAPVYLAAVLEYLTSEIIELAGNCAKDGHRKRITPRDLLVSVKLDMELNKLLKGVTFPEGGVLPGVCPEILPKKINYNKPTKTVFKNELW